MKVKLTRDAAIMHKAGEIVEVSPERAAFLKAAGAACDVQETAKKQQPKKQAE